MFATKSKSVQERRVMLDVTLDSSLSSGMRDQEPAECLFPLTMEDLGHSQDCGANYSKLEGNRKEQAWTSGKP